MQAIAMGGIGGTEVLTKGEVPYPDLGPQEVLVKVGTVGVNHLDLATMRGEGLARNVRTGHIPGIDPAGTLVEVGVGVSDHRVGERVVVRPVVSCGCCRWCVDGKDDSCEEMVFVGIHRQGGFAEFVAVPESNVHAIPGNVEFAAASAFSHSFPVALQMLREWAQVCEDDTVLVTGAAGAVGTAAVQIAKYFGARVIAVTGSSDRADWCLTLDADLAIDYGTMPQFAEQILEFSPTGVDVCIETTGSADLWKQLSAVAAKRSRVVGCGGHVSGQVPLDLFWLFRNRVTVMGSAASTNAAFADALAMFAEEEMVAPVHRIVPFTEFQDAFDLLGERDRIGKVVLEVSRPAT